MDAWPFFPGLKVGQIHLYSSFLIIWWRFMTFVRSTIISELCGLLELFFFGRFCFSQ
jgi:hypothetical protein